MDLSPRLQKFRQRVDERLGIQDQLLVEKSRHLALV